jgi:hypothetical protein
VDLLAVLFYGGQLERPVRVDVGAVARLGVAGDARAMVVLEALGDEGLDA